MNQSAKFSTADSSRTHGENGLASASTELIAAYSEPANLPQVLMDQIIYFHSKPNDLVFDPFAGTGVTVDSCKMLSRRCYCSDLYVCPGREQDIKPWDITYGLPPDLPDPDLVILDPPFSEDMYCKFRKPTGDLSKMNLVQSNGAIRSLLNELIRRKVKTIAFVMPHERHAVSSYLCDDAPDFDFKRVLYYSYEIVQCQAFVTRTENYGAQKVENAEDSNVDPFVKRKIEFWQPQRQETDHQNGTRDIFAETLFGSD